MGYYTYYKLSVVNEEDFTKEQLQDAASRLAKRLDYDGEIPTSDPFAWLGNESMKWYDHEEDLMRLSDEYPDMVFFLEGWGEEFDDVWRKYFKNGAFKSYHRHYYWDPVPEWLMRS